MNQKEKWSKKNYLGTKLKKNDLKESSHLENPHNLPHPSASSWCSHSFIYQDMFECLFMFCSSIYLHPTFFTFQELFLTSSCPFCHKVDPDKIISSGPLVTLVLSNDDGPVGIVLTISSILVPWYCSTSSEHVNCSRQRNIYDYQ